MIMLNFLKVERKNVKSGESKERSTEEKKNSKFYLKGYFDSPTSSHKLKFDEWYSTFILVILLFFPKYLFCFAQ